MRSIERRLDRLEAKIPAPDCGHGIGKMLFLVDPTEEEIEKVEKELNACPQCVKSRGNHPWFVIFHRFGKDKEEPKPEVQGFEFEVAEKTAKNGNHKINFTTY